MSKRNKNLLISLLIVVGWALVSYSILVDKISYGAFILFVVILGINYAIFIVGAITLILRIKFGTKDKNSLFYILCGSLNAYTGCFGLYEFYENHLVNNLFFLSVLCLFIGFFILIDIFSSKMGSSPTK